MGFSIPSLTTLPRVHLALGGGFSGGVLRIRWPRAPGVSQDGDATAPGIHFMGFPGSPGDLVPAFAGQAGYGFGAVFFSCRLPISQSCGGVAVGRS